MARSGQKGPHGQPQPTGAEGKGHRATRTAMLLSAFSNRLDCFISCHRKGGRMANRKGFRGHMVQTLHSMKLSAENQTDGPEVGEQGSAGWSGGSRD